MQFLNPWYLLGLVLASIPVVIHLLIIRRNKTIEFSSLRFLKELQKSQIRKLKLKQILLLILRTLIIIFLILSFARPVVQSNIPLFRNYSNISSVIILDNSFSMDVSDEFGNRFRQAKNFATRLLEQFKDGDQVALIFTTDSKQYVDFTSDFQFLKGEIARTNVSVIPASYENSFRVAQKILSKSNNFFREIFLVSDFQKIELKSFADSSRFFDAQTTLNLVHIGKKSKISIDNISIDSVIPLTKIYEHGKQVDFEVYLSNYSEKGFENLVLSLFVNGERSAQRLFNINGNGKQKVIIGTIIKPKGIVRCAFEIESDVLEYDNRRWFGFNAPDLLRVGLIGDKENSFVYHFLKSLNGDKINFVFISPNQLSISNLVELNSLIIESPIIDEFGLRVIRDFVKDGKGILVFPPSNGDMIAINKFFGGLGINLNFESKTFQSNNFPAFTFIDNNHPLFTNVFRPFKEPNIQMPDPPKLKTLVTTSSGIALINSNAGQFLTEFKLEGSKILFCGTAPNLEWGNFPLTSFFPVLLFRSMFYLSNTNEYNFNIICGEPLTINLPKGLSPTNLYKIEDPLMNVSTVQTIQLPSGTLVELRNLELVGTYGLRNGEDKPIGAISVNVDSKESNLELSEREEIIDYFKKVLNINTKINYIEDVKRINNQDFREYSGTELWKLFLILALVSALAEMYVARTTNKQSSD